MIDENKSEEEKWHMKMAKDCFNKTWGLLEKKRTSEEDETMVHIAHASRYHWEVVGTALNLQRGEWLIARVYTVLKRAYSALHHANICLKLTEDHQLKGFDLAYAYEAMARASAADGNYENYEKYLELAKETGNQIGKKEDRDWFFKDLESEPWFGMKKL